MEVIELADKQVLKVEEEVSHPSPGWSQRRSWAWSGSNIFGRCVHHLATLVDQQTPTQMEILCDQITVKWGCLRLS